MSRFVRLFKQCADMLVKTAEPNVRHVLQPIFIQQLPHHPKRICSEESEEQNAYLPQLQQFVGSDLPLWKNSQTDCASGVSTSASLRCPCKGLGTGRGSRELSR